MNVIGSARSIWFAKLLRSGVKAHVVHTYIILIYKYRVYFFICLVIWYKLFLYIFMFDTDLNYCFELIVSLRALLSCNHDLKASRVRTQYPTM